MPALRPESNPHPIKRRLVEAGTTQRRAAAILGINESDLARVLNGYIEPGERLRADLAAILNVPDVGLFHDDLPSTDGRAHPHPRL